MEIKNNNLQFKNSLEKRPKTDYLIIHHSANSKASVEDIHRIHLAKGWSGIGYHFYITKEGLIYTGRPIDTIGAHTEGVNSQSIGICFEGNFEKEFMNNVQVRAGQELISYLKSLYPNILIKKHSDFNPTACPGKNLRFDEIKNNPKKITQQSELISINDIVWELHYRGIITNKELWLKKLNEDENAYWLARKCANMTVNK